MISPFLYTPKGISIKCRVPSAFLTWAPGYCAGVTTSDVYPLTDNKGSGLRSGGNQGPTETLKNVFYGNESWIHSINMYTEKYISKNVEYKIRMPATEIQLQIAIYNIYLIDKNYTILDDEISEDNKISKPPKSFLMKGKPREYENIKF